MTVLCHRVCLSLSDCLFRRYTYTNRLAEDGGAEAARETSAGRIGGHRQQARRARPSLGQSRKGVS